MSLNIKKEVAALKRMTVSQLQDKYLDVYGETTNGRHKQWLDQKDCLANAGERVRRLSARALARAREIANTADLRVIPPSDPTVIPDRVPGRSQLHLPRQDGRLPAPGLTIPRMYKGVEYVVTVMENGFEFEGEFYKSLSAIAKEITGQHWNGYRFFKLEKSETRPMIRATETPQSKRIRCAIYTRKSTEDGLEQEFNSLDAQRDAGEAYIASQLHEGWECLPTMYDDGGYTGGNLDRPAMQRLMSDIDDGKIDCVVVYKVDRLSRSLMDFSRDHGEVRCPRRRVRFGDPAIQHRQQYGQVDPERVVVFRPIRARDDQRADARQDRRRSPPRQMVRWHAAARIQRDRH